MPALPAPCSALLLHWGREKSTVSGCRREPLWLSPAFLSRVGHSTGLPSSKRSEETYKVMSVPYFPRGYIKAGPSGVGFYILAGVASLSLRTSLIFRMDNLLPAICTSWSFCRRLMAGLSIIQRRLTHQTLNVADYSGMGGRNGPEYASGNG